MKAQIVAKASVRKIVLVGAGALGSHVALFLRNLDFQAVASARGSVYSLVAVDMDRLEQKNVMSQFHAKTSVGRNKAESLKQALNFLFGTGLESIPHRLTADNVEKLLGGATLVIDCLDNGASRRIVQTFVREMKIPCLHGALAANGTVGGVVWDDKFRIDDEDGEGAATCEDGEHLPFIGMVASIMARSAQEFLASGRQMSFRVFSRSAPIPL